MNVGAKIMLTGKRRLPAGAQAPAWYVRMPGRLVGYSEVITGNSTSRIFLLKHRQTCQMQPRRFVLGLAESFPLSQQSLFLPACFQRNR